MSSESNTLNREDDSAAKRFVCESCGNQMEFDIESQKIKCPSCGNIKENFSSEKNINEYDFDFDNLSKADIDFDNFVHVVKCSQCGSEITIPKEITSIECLYCGSKNVLETKQNAGIRPEGILLFKVDKASAIMIFKKWVKSRFFAPNALKYSHQGDKMKNLYIPYWTYDAETYNSYTGLGGKDYYVTVGSGDNQRTEVRTNWYPVSGRFDLAFDDVLVSAGRDNLDIAKRVESYNTEKLVPFETVYLSGVLTEKYTLKPKEGFEKARIKMENHLVSEARGKILMRYDHARNVHVQTRYENIKFKHVLFPVYMSSYKYKDKIYNYVINGYNGEIRGSYPKSAIKITIAVILAIIVIFILYYFYVNYSQ